MMRAPNGRIIFPAIDVFVRDSGLRVIWTDCRGMDFPTYTRVFTTWNDVLQHYGTSLEHHRVMVRLGV